MFSAFTSSGRASGISTHKTLPGASFVLFCTILLSQVTCPSRIKFCTADPGKLRQRLRNQFIGALARRCDLNLMQLRHTYFPTPSAVVSVGSFTFLSAASFLSLKNKYHTANKIAPTTTQQSAKLNTYGKNSTWM